MAQTRLGLSMVDQGLGEKAVSYTVLGGDFSFKHPTILYLGGRFNKSHEMSCCGIRFIERVMALLNITRDKVQFVASCYQNLSPEEAQCEEMYLRLQKQGTLTPEEKEFLDKSGFDSARLKYPGYLSDLYEDYVKPLISHPSIDGKPEKLPFAAALRNMRCVNIVAHSQGTCAAVMFGDLLYEKMLAMGYTKAEAVQIERQVFVLSAGSIAPLGVSRFTTVNFVSLKDKRTAAGFLPSGCNHIIMKQMPLSKGVCRFYRLGVNESVLTVDELCHNQGEQKDKIEHALKNYLSEGEHKKTPQGRLGTQIALDLFAASVCNSVFNSRTMHFSPLDKALKGNVNPSMEAVCRNSAAGQALLDAKRGVRPSMFTQINGR